MRKLALTVVIAGIATGGVVYWAKHRGGAVSSTPLGTESAPNNDQAELSRLDPATRHFLAYFVVNQVATADVVVLADVWFDYATRDIHVAVKEVWKGPPTLTGTDFVVPETTYQMGLGKPRQREIMFFKNTLTRLTPRGFILADNQALLSVHPGLTVDLLHRGVSWNVDWHRELAATSSGRK